MLTNKTFYITCFFMALLMVLAAVFGACLYRMFTESTSDMGLGFSFMSTFILIIVTFIVWYIMANPENNKR